MTWITTIQASAATGPLREFYSQVYALYPAEYGAEVPAILRADGTADSIVAAHSLIPEAMWHGMSTLGVLLSPTLPLDRRQHEMIATLVSALNNCFY